MFGIRRRRPTVPATIVDVSLTDEELLSQLRALPAEILEVLDQGIAAVAMKLARADAETIAWQLSVSPVAADAVEGLQVVRGGAADAQTRLAGLQRRLAGCMRLRRLIVQVREKR